MFCLCAAVGLQILFINLSGCRHPKRSIKGFRELRFQVSVCWYHFRPPLWEHWARRSSCRDNPLPSVAMHTSMERFSVKGSNIKRLHRAETNQTIHTLKCMFLTLVCYLRIVSWASVGSLWSVKILGKLQRFSVRLYKEPKCQKWDQNVF